jgi:hypothetical protein
MSLEPVQIACSWWRPRRATTGPSSRSRPLGRTSRDQIMRVAPAAGSKVDPPSTSTEGIVVREPNLLGISHSVTSMSISTVRRPDLAVARNRVPTAIGPSVIFSDGSMRGLFLVAVAAKRPPHRQHLTVGAAPVAPVMAVLITR